MNDVDTYEALKYHWIIWKLNGIERPHYINRKFYVILRIIINFCINFIFPLTLILNIFFTTTIDDICDNLNMTTTCLICNLKFLNIYVVRKKLKNIKQLTNYLDSRNLNECEQLIIRKSIKITNMLFKILSISYTLAVFLSILVPLLATEPTLMYPAWFPFNWKNSKLNFALITAYQSIGLAFQAIQQVAHDTCPTVLLSIIAAYIKILALRINKIGVDENKTSQENYADLRRCMQDHQVILSLYQECEEIISGAGFAQLIGSAIVQCTAGIYLLKPNFLAKQFLAYAILLAVTTEVFVLCFFSNILTVASEELSRAIYDCNWVGQSKAFRKDLILFIRDSQKILVIRAGNYIALSLQTFVTTIKTAYSFFAVLRSVN